MPVRLPIAILAAVLVATPLAGCLRKQYDPARATAPYPARLHTTKTVDVEVFRAGENIELVSATATGFEDFRVWINQRYVMNVDRLPPGGRVRLSLWDFWDERGEVFNAGGILRTEAPSPVRLVEIEEGGRMVGLVTIGTEPAEPGRPR